MNTRWGLVEDIFQAAVDLPEPERKPYIAQRCAGDVELRWQLESLIQLAPGADEFIGPKVIPFPDPRGLRSGTRVGAYRLEREIGEGGMATVYLARRDDGQFDQQVAVKLIKRGLDSPEAVNRFCWERQVLAGLSHPNIARLLDGGSTDDGVPYLVMEYIEGQPVTAHCRERHLPIRGRLELFLGVCDAVSYAHRNLVVHRDIKPGNILVTDDGTPKLLDFGISKLLDPLREAQPSSTMSLAVRPMTPEYASPEQACGEPITTATDVYSLGVVLYEMLTGRCPYRVEAHSAAAIERAVCESEPSRPSAIAGRKIDADLDNIVLMAMRKEPMRRYASVDRLADDIRRYLGGLPVLAREDTLVYRASKFVARNKTAVAAAVLLAISVLGGVAATAWQARRVAEQVARTERRFLQFRKLGNAFLFDFHDKIRGLKDLSEARELVLATGIEYMDGLAREAEGDPILVRELALAYEKLGDLQGFRNDAALGRPHDAFASYRKAVALLDPLDRSGEADYPSLILLSRSSCGAGSMIEAMGGSAANALPHYRRCLDTGLRAAAGRSLTPRLAGILSRAYHSLGDAEMAAGNRVAAFKSYTDLLALLEEHRTRLGLPCDMWIAETKLRMGKLYATGGEHTAALRELEQALAPAARASAAGQDRQTRRAALIVYTETSRHAAKMRASGQPAPDPAKLARQALELARSLAAAYPHHPWSSRDLQSALEL